MNTPRLPLRVLSTWNGYAVYAVVHDLVLTKRRQHPTAPFGAIRLVQHVRTATATAGLDYPSEHAVIAGACVAVLKACFDESFPVDRPVVPRADGLALEAYAGPTLTVGHELDKLASNVAYGRNAAGIHWRTHAEAEAGLRLGEAVALATLREVDACLHEGPMPLTFTRFDGTVTTVSRAE